MDPFTIIENMSSYQANEWSEMTGLPASTMIPAFVALVVGGIGLQLLPLLSS